MFKRTLIILLVLVAASFALAQGGPPDHGLGGPGAGTKWLMPGKWWKHPKAAQELALTQEQITKLEDIFLKHKTAMIDLKADIDKKSLELDNLFDKEPIDERGILTQADRVIAGRGELQKAYIKMVLDMRKILNSDQIKKLRAFREQLHSYHRDERPFREGRDNKPGAPKPPTPPPEPPDTPPSPNQNLM